MDKLNKEVKRYLIRELKDYYDNKKIIEELRQDIIDESPKITLGVPKGKNRSESMTNKVYKLMTNNKINRLEKMCYKISKVLEGLNDIEYQFFIRCFEKNQSKVKICIEMSISESTFHRYKNKIIYSLAEELGFLL